MCRVVLTNEMSEMFQSQAGLSILTVMHVSLLEVMKFPHDVCR